MKRRNQRKNKAVAPVLATLLMIAVAVAMSVIIFMWSQGFLSQTSESTGAQQGSQNQAAQSSIAIETVTGTAGLTTPSLTILVRNVGAIAVNIGSVTVTGLSSNALFNGSLIATVATAITLDVLDNDNLASDCVWSGDAGGAGLQTIAKGGGSIITLSAISCSDDPGADTRIASGDVVTVKVTTDKGTFAQASYTVP